MPNRIEEPESKKCSEKDTSNTMKNLNGCIQIEDLIDYPTFKKKEKPIVTDYASTIDQDLSLTYNNPTHYEEF